MPPDARPGRPRLQCRSTVLAWVLPHLLAHVTAVGADAGPIRRLPGIRGRDLDDPDTRLPDAAAREAWRLAGEITGDGAIGLHMAQAIPAGALDLLEYAFRSSPNLGSAFEQLARYGRVISDRAAFRLTHDSASLQVTIGGEGAEAVRSQRANFSLAFVVRLCREATGTSVSPREVLFAGPRPDSLFEHRTFFRAALSFEESANRLVYSSADAQLPLRSADPGLAAVVHRRLDRMLAQRPPEGGSTAGDVRRVILEFLPRGEPTAAAVARELGLSVRTLGRRLRAEGMWFRGALDAVRGERAAALLRDPAVGIGEIAFVLGYSEPAAFHRSFKRWTGQTPLAFRRAARAA